MNLSQMLRDLSEVYTLEQIKEMCGFASRGHVHDVRSGKQKEVGFALGTLICQAHGRLEKQKKRAAKNGR